MIKTIENETKIEKIVNKLSAEQKAKILDMTKPQKVGDSQNYEKKCKFIIEECGFAIYQFDEVKKALQKERNKQQ